jgi:predicted dehydrogenase
MDIDELLARDDINLVYIATPPFLHHAQAMKAAASRQACHL